HVTGPRPQLEHARVGRQRQPVERLEHAPLAETIDLAVDAGVVVHRLPVGGAGVRPVADRGLAGRAHPASVPKASTAGCASRPMPRRANATASAAAGSGSAGENQAPSRTGRSDSSQARTLMSRLRMA